MILNASAANGSASSASRVGRLPRRVLARHRRDVGRRRQEVDDRVEQRLHALVLERRAAEHRHGAARRWSRGGAPRAAASVGRSSLLEVPRASPRRRPRRSPRSSSRARLAAASASSSGISATSGVAPSVSSSQSISFIVDQVDDARELVLEPDRDLDDDRRARAGARGSRCDAAIGIGADAVALVDERDARHAVVVGLAPHRLATAARRRPRRRTPRPRRRARAGSARPRW